MTNLVQEPIDISPHRSKSKYFFDAWLPEREDETLGFTKILPLESPYKLTKTSAGIHIKSLQNEVIHIYEPLEGNVLVIEGGIYVIHAPCTARLVQVNAESIEFRADVTSTQINLKAQASAFYANVTTDLLQADIQDEFYLDEKAVVSTNVLDLQAITANCLGTLNVAKVTKVDVNQIEFGGNAEWKGIAALNVDRLICYDGSNLSVDHTHSDNSTVLNIDQKVMIQEHASINLKGHDKQQMIFKTKELSQSGNLECHATVIDSDNIRVGKNANFTATLSEVHGKKAVVKGEMSLQTCLVNVDEFLQSKKASLHCRDSEVQSSSYLKVDGELDAKRSHLIGKNVVVRADTKLTKSTIHADDIKIQTKQLKSSDSQFIGKHILLDAEQGNQQHKKLALQADSLQTRGAIVLQNSQISIIHQGIFTNHGDLKLADCSINCAGQISNAKHANLQITNTITDTQAAATTTFTPDVSAGYISNQGDISIYNAKIATKNMSHTGQEFILDNAMCYVETGLKVNDNAQLKLVNKSMLLDCQDAIVAAKSKIEVKSGSKVDAKSFYTLPQAQVEISDSHLSIERVGLLGRTSISKSQFQSHSTTVVGHLTTNDTPLLIDSLFVHGAWLNKNTQLIAKDSVLLASQAKITSIDLMIKTKQLEIQAKINLEGSTLWHADNLTTQSESVVTGSSLKVEAHTWSHSGSIKLNNELHAKGAELLNAGQLSAAGTVNLGFNYLVNIGSLNSTNLTVNTASYLNAGIVSGHNIKINSLMNVNAGITQAYNLQINSLQHTNMGLYIPDLSHPEECFTLSSMQSAGKIIATNLLPDFSTFIQFMFSAPAFLRTMQAAWKGRGEVSFDKIKQYYLHEYVEHVLNVSQFVSTGKQLLEQSSTICADLQNGWKNLTREAAIKQWDTIKESLSLADIAKAVPTAAVKAIAPKITTQTLADVSAGAMASANINEISYSNTNSGSRYALDSYTIDGDQIIDTGKTYSVLGGVTYKGKNIKTQGDIHSYNDRVNLQAQTVAITPSDEPREHHNFTIKSENLQFTGEHTFSSSIMLAKHTQFGNETNDDKQQTTFTAGSILTTATADFHQDVHLSQSIMQIDAAKHATKIYLSNQSHLDVRGEHHLIGAGIVIAEEQSRLSNETLRLTDQAQVDLKSESVLTSKKLQVKDNAVYKTNKSITKVTSIETLDKGYVKVENGSFVKADAIKNAGRYESQHSQTFTDRVDVLTGGAVQLHAHSSLMTKTIATAGDFDATLAEVEAENINVEKTGVFQLETSNLKAKELTSDGKTAFTAMLAQIDTRVSFSATAENTMADATLKTALLEDKGQIKVAGTAILDVDHFDHQGKMQLQADADATNAKLVVKAKTADLKGSSNLSNAVFAINNFHHAASFAMGQGEYSQYVVSDALKVKTAAAMHLTGPYLRHSDLSAEATTLVVDANFKGDFDLHFKATEGSLVIHGTSEINKFHGEAQGDILTDAVVDAKKDLILHSEAGKLENKNTLAGENTLLKAKSIINSGSSIIGRDKNLMHATDGDIVNQGGGVIRGGNYTQLQASGNVINKCDEKLIRDRHDNRMQYTASVIEGGAGVEGSKGVGVNIVAGGKVINHGSSIASDGQNAMNAAHGVEFTAATHTYVSKDEEWKSGFLGCNHHHTMATTTQIQQSQMISKTGKNTIYSEHGGLDSVGGQFISAQGTQADVKKDINALSVKTRDREVTEDSGWFGLTHDNKNQLIESSKPTVVADNGHSILRSRDGDINAIGTLFIGDKGDLTLEANNINLKQDVNNTETHIEVQSLGFSVLGVSAFNTAKDGGSVGDVLSELDPTARSINNLVNSEGVAGNVAGAANFGVDTFNTVGSLASAFNQDSLGGAALQRYGLGDRNGFKPSASLTVSQTTTDIKTQTPGSGGVHKNNVTCKAKQVINIEGYDINAENDINLEAKEVNLVSLALESSSSSHTEKVTVSLTATGDVTNVGVGYSESSSHSTQHLHSHMNAKANLHVTADKMTMRGANIVANSISGHVNTLEMQSVQDEMSSQSKSIEVNTSGMVSMSSQSHDSKEVRQVTGIHVKTALNNPDKAFTVGVLKQKGASVTSDIIVNDFAESTSTESIHDYTKTHGIGYSINPLTITDGDKGLLQQIQTVSLSVTHQDKKSLVHSTGEREVLVDTNIKFKANIPIINAEIVNNTLDQIEQAGNKILSSSGLPSVESKDSTYRLGAFNLNENLHKPSELLPAARFELQSKHHVSQSESTDAKVQPHPKDLKEHKEQPKVETVKPAATSSKYELTPAVHAAIERLANCGSVPFNYVGLVEALALASTGVGMLPAAIFATYTLDEFMVNLAMCMEGVKRDSYLTQFMKATVPDFEREYSLIKQAYILMYPKAGFFTSAKQSLDVVMASGKTHTQITPIIPDHVSNIPHHHQPIAANGNKPDVSHPHKPAAPHDHKPKTTLFAEPEHPVTRSASTTIPDSQLPIGKVDITPKIIKPLPTKPKGKVIIKPKIINPLDTETQGRVIIKPKIIKPLDTESKRKALVNPVIVKPLPTTVESSAATSPTAHKEPGKDLLVIPHPVTTTTQGHANFFKQATPELLRDLNDKSKTRFEINLEKGIKENPNRFGLLNPEELKLPRLIEPTNPDYAVALTSENRILNKAQFLQEKEYPHAGLLSDSLASTFAGHRYRTYLLTEPAVLSRAGTYPVPFGRFFSFEPPQSEIQSRIDKAILPIWPGGAPSPVDSVHRFEFPAGTTIHVGEIAGQGNGFWGHTKQIVIDDPWNIPGVKHLSGFPLKQEKTYQKYQSLRK